MTNAAQGISQNVSKYSSAWLMQLFKTAPEFVFTHHAFLNLLKAHRQANMYLLPY